MLAASPDLLMLGELRPSFRHYSPHERCDCGEVRARCPFWGQADRGLHFDGRDDAAQVQRAYSLANLPRLIGVRLRLLGPDDPTKLVLARLERTLHVAAGTVVVDTSKTPVGVLLWRCIGVEVHVISSVRNPLSVARAQRQPASVSGLRSVSLPRTFFEWSAYHLLMLAVAPFATSIELVSFARLRRDPRRFAESCWRRFGVARGAVVGRAFTLRQSHILNGNPRRSKGSLLEVRP